MTGRTLRKAMGPPMLVAAMLLAAFPPAFGEPSVCEAGDPPVGVNLVSWWNFGAEGKSVWEDAVQRAHDFGFRAVSLSPLRFVDLTTGAIALSDGSTSGPDLSHIAAGVARARQLGMIVTLNPFVEPEGFGSWRGQMNFSGSVKVAFFANYQSYLVEVAEMGREKRAQRMNVGTELKALVNDPAHAGDWQALISTVETHFQGQLGYAANWDNYTSANLTTAIWEHPDIDYLGVDAYFPLAKVAEADGLGSPPDGPEVSSVEVRWNDVLDVPGSGFNHGVLSFAAARKAGAGMPVVLTEHGLIPYNRTTTVPWSTGPSTYPADPDEQADGYRALLRALDQRRQGGLLEVHVWHWGMPGAAGSLWYLDPEGDPVTEGATAAQILSNHESQCPPSCSDGLDNDGDESSDFPADPGCASADDHSESSPLLPCDDGIDNDSDGRIDFDPVTLASPGDRYTLPAGSGDPGCQSPSHWTENPQCQDGFHNDGDGMMDYDGGLSIYEAGDPRLSDPDPQCLGKPWKNRETQPASCGLGLELMLAVPPLLWLSRRRRAGKG